MCLDVGVGVKRKAMEMGKYIFEPQNDKINKVACALSEDSDQPASAQPDQSLHCGHGGS